LLKSIRGDTGGTFKVVGESGEGGDEGGNDNGDLNDYKWVER